ncbi:hypothetical protein AAE478_004886 [Parahypoxylon ruwenzoriense]
MSHPFKARLSGSGEFRPVNKLNGNNNHNSSSPIRPPPVRHRSSSPPTKRQKVEGHNTHTQSHFVLHPTLDETADKPIPRKRSFGSHSDSQQTIKSHLSNARGSHSNVSEFRNVEDAVKIPLKREQGVGRLSRTRSGQLETLSEGSP